ncbi:spore coat U domain-containing protein [Mesorhizobium sp. M7A.F.Ca.US.001.02.1.1]|uniref:Csu type fimbrial protein n=1 Tax=unclassified Mesorhizobium TaxID=325217 RepID=UPI002693165C
MLRLVIFMAFAMFPLSALAQSCSFSVSNMNFGLVDTLSGSQTNTTATINMNCSGIVGQRILICAHLAAGTGGASSATARQMFSGANALNYQLYPDSARSVVWGSFAWAYASRPPALALTPKCIGLSHWNGDYLWRRGRRAGNRSTWNLPFDILRCADRISLSLYLRQQLQYRLRYGGG